MTLHFLTYLKNFLYDFAKSKGICAAIQEKIVIDTTKQADHGHFATNIALVCAKSIGTSPQEFAKDVVNALKNLGDNIEHVSIAGPGFINITLSSKTLHQSLHNIYKNGPRFGLTESGKGQSVNIEYVSANPTGPLHIGHGRNAIFGDVVANLYQAIGYHVIREYYVNDAGGQVDALNRSVALRCHELAGKIITDADFDADMYKGEYLIDVAKAITKKDSTFLSQDSFSIDQTKALKNKVLTLMLKAIQEDLGALGVVMDVYTSERSLIDAGIVFKAIQQLEKDEFTYQGTLEKPKGIDDDSWQARDQLIFKSTQWGDDQDRVLTKYDGTPTYFAGDVGYHFDKIARKFDHLVNILGFDHTGYIKRIHAAVKALSKSQEFSVKVTQMVNFMDNGQPLKMSKRAGTFVTLKDLVEKVGKSMSRFMMVSRHQDMPIDFDFVKVVENTPDNPLFYLYYANARIHSIINRAKNEQIEGKITNLNCLTEPLELEMIKIMILWPSIIESSALHMEPHRLTTYLHQLAALFHGLWNAGRDHVVLRFIDTDRPDVTSARVILLQSVSSILEDGFKLLGVETVRELR